MRYESTEEDRNALKRSYVGFLKEDYLWIDVGAKIQEASEGKIRVNYLGGTLVFIQPANYEIIKIEDLECITFWFDSIRLWSEDVIDNNRIIWTNWFGVPMHAWNPNFFNLVSCKFGKILRIDEDTLHRRKLQMARILIRTPYHEIPRTPIEVEIDGKIFQIRVREEIKDLEEDFDDWSSEDVIDDDSVSESNSAPSDSDVEESPPKFMAVSDGEPTGGKIEETHTILGDNSVNAPTPTLEQAQDYLIAANYSMLSPTPKETFNYPHVPSIVVTTVDPLPPQLNAVDPGDLAGPGGPSQIIRAHRKNKRVSWADHEYSAQDGINLVVDLNGPVSFDGQSKDNAVNNLSISDFQSVSMNETNEALVETSEYRHTSSVIRNSHRVEQNRCGESSVPTENQKTTTSNNKFVDQLDEYDREQNESNSEISEEARKAWETKS
ncbi:hypothetical protein ACS0TY_020847 [Phlomoides rotata]